MQTMERPKRAKRDFQALVSIVRCGPDKGIAALRLVDDTGAAGEHFIPFAVRESPSQLGHDYTYAGLIAALERLRSLDVKRVLVQTDDQSVVAEIERRVDPHRDLTLPYIMLGCKLNEFAAARLIAVPAQRCAPLRAKAMAFASTVYKSVA
jgi:hypothetical protein